MFDITDIIEKILITNNNIEEEIKNKNPFAIHYYGDELTEENVNKLKESKKFAIHLNNDEIRRMFDVGIEEDIFYLFKYDEKGIYRRSKLLNYLKKNYNVLDYPFKETTNTKAYINSIINKLYSYKKKPLVIISQGECNFTFNKIVEFLIMNDIKFVYDKYDEIKDDIINQYYSSLLFASSKTILDNVAIKNKKAFYIPNGCSVKPNKTDVKKYEKKTAVYAGRNINKIDFNLLNLLKALNEDWDIEVVGIPNEELDRIKEENPDLIIKPWMSEEDLHDELCKCHLGLCLLEVSDITKNQLSDKFFNYVNAHIPTLINEELKDNYTDYEDFVSCLDFEKLELENYLKEVSDDKYNMLLATCSWNNRFDEMFKIIKDEGLLAHQPS